MLGGIVKIADVSDFISPSQACILPLPNSDASAKFDAAEPLVGVHAKRAVEKPKAPSTPREKISVQLRDCLACSGCVTTAETVLIGEQNAAAVLAAMAAHRSSDGGSDGGSHGGSDGGIVVVTVAPQALASIAAAFNWTSEKTAHRLARFLRAHGATHIVDSSFARLLALEALADEFCRRNLDVDASPATILAGACPGFVCYVEKRRHEVLDAMSRIRSPQAMAGALIKRYLSERRRRALGDRWRASNILHVALMPCYDKKLEASRPQFTTHDDDDASDGDDAATREVDSVITPTELERPLADFYAAHDDAMAADEASDDADEDASWLRAFECGHLLADAPANSDGGEFEGSGGYAMRVVQATREHFAAQGIETRVERSTDASGSGDMATIIVRPTNDDNARSIVVIKAYGFRSIQNVLRRLRTRRLQADFIEIMACPSGCVNGGGLIRAPIVDGDDAANTADPNAQAAQLQRTIAVYKSLDDSAYRTTLVAAARAILERWRAADANCERHFVADVVAAAEFPTNSVAALQW